MPLKQLRRIISAAQVAVTKSQLLGLGRSLLMLSLPLLILCSGCANLPNLFSARLSAPLELSIRQVEPAGRPGTYRIDGSTSLPDQTQLSVAAIRYLQSPLQPPSDPAVNPIYSILDRQYVQVNQGNWQATLNLWQVAPDGSYQEAWQLAQQGTGVSLRPQPTITFMATLDPPEQPSNFRSQVESQAEDVQAALARFTTDGELYVQADKTIDVPLPTGSTSPPAPPPAATARRSSNAPAITNNTEPASASDEAWTQTNAPLPRDRFLR